MSVLASNGLAGILIDQQTTRHFALSRIAPCIGASAVLLAGCGASQLPIGAPRAMPQSQASAIVTHSERREIGAQPVGWELEMNAEACRERE